MRGAAAGTGSDDWRVTVRPAGDGQAGAAAAHLSSHKAGAELARRLGSPVAVGAGAGRELFLYTSGPQAAEAARDSARELLADRGVQAQCTVERWHPVAQEWEPPGVALPATDAEIDAELARRDAEQSAESLAAGRALFEVRVQLPGHRDAVALAGRLAADGYSVVRRWRFLVVGANSEGQAEEFAARIRDQAPDGSVTGVEQVGEGRPYTIFELAAGSGL